jgi:hypothetical protein
LLASWRRTVKQREEKEKGRVGPAPEREKGRGLEAEAARKARGGSRARAACLLGP